MPAECFTVGLGPTIGSDVAAYFQKFGVLPPHRLAVGSTRTPPGPPSFETLLTAIRDSASQDFVVVVHGFPDGSGLYLKLAHHRNTLVGTDTRHEHLQRLMDIGRRGNITAADRQGLQLNDAQIHQLGRLMGEVHGKQIGTIEFRGCNLGRSRLSLERFRAFLGAQRFGAPNLHSFFGVSQVGTGQHLLATHQQGHQGTTHTYSTNFRDPSGVCHCCIGINAESKPANGHVIADSTDSVTRWIRQNFDARQSYERGHLAIHGLWEFTQINLDDPDPLGDLEARPRPIFPLAANNEYRSHIQYSVGAAPAR